MVSASDSGDLTVSAGAALLGSYGISTLRYETIVQAVIDDNNTLYVRDDTPNAEPRYRARFYFDPNSISL